MSFITDIKEKIRTIGPAEFQEFCDVLLSKMHPDWNIHELGMKSGTGKTTIGNPDTYFRIENGDKAGKYVFVAYTTQSEGIYQKIRDDIEKCLDEIKTGLSTKDIDEIIVCHTSDNLKAGDDKKLHDLCGKIHLEIFGVDRLADLVYNRFPTIASDILHFPVGTGQIYDADDFIRVYDSNNLAAPLDTPFLFRKEQCQEIVNTLKDKPFIVLTGSAGIGKTRLALEVCRQYAALNQAKMFCIKNNGLSLYEDFIRWVEQPEKYVILIDDANDTEQLQAILNYNADKSKYDLHFVMTVRDYAKDNVIKTVQMINEPAVFEISSLSDEEITEFIGTVLDIREMLYVDRILEIAEGNPRVAYMAGKLANEHDLSKMIDVSGLLDQYYTKVIDHSIGNDEQLCITAGILAMIHVVSLNDLKDLDEIFHHGIIDQQTFIQCSRRLVSLEVAEEKYSTITFSDQCFANYMLYYTFFKKKIVPFSEVLDIGFRSFRDETVQSTNIILNNFRSKAVRKYLVEQIRIVWNQYRQDTDQELFEEFSGIYHLLFPEESLLIAKNEIDAMKAEEISDSIDFDKKLYDYSDHVLTLLSGYENVECDFESAMELALQYAMKSELHLIKFKNWFNENFKINENSFINGLLIQEKAIAFMEKHCLDSIRSSRLFLLIGSEWLNIEFNPVSIARKHSLKVYQIVCQYTEKTAQYRSSLLEMILVVVESAPWKKEMKGDILYLLQKYAQYIQNGMNQMFTDHDAPYIERILNNLDNDLSKAVIVNHLLKGCSTHHYDAPWKLDFNSIFASESWKVYSLFSNDYGVSGQSDAEYSQKRQKRIENFAKTLNIDNMQTFVISVEQCICVLKQDHHSLNSPYLINDGLRILCDAISTDHELSIAYLKAVQKNGKSITNRPYSIFKRETDRNYRDFYEFIKSGKYASNTIRNDWLYIYFVSVAEEHCDQWMIDQLLQFLKDDSDQYFEECSARPLDFLIKFHKSDPDIFPKASKIILAKSSYKKFFPSVYFASLFQEYSSEKLNPENLLSLYKNEPVVLQDIYFYELQHDDSSDYSGKYLSYFCCNDPAWLKLYCDCLFKVRGQYCSSVSEQGRLESLWQLDIYESLFDFIFQYGVKVDDSKTLLKNSNVLRYAIGHYSKNLDIREKQKKWYLHLIEQYAGSDRLKYVFLMCSDLDDESRLDMFQKFFELNQNYDDFKVLPLFPISFAVWGSLIPTYEKNKKFLFQLRDMMNDIKFLEHRNLINEMISDLDHQISSEETRETLEKINGW